MRAAASPTLLLEAGIQGPPPCGPGMPGLCPPRGQPLTWPPGTWLERSLDILLVDWVQSLTSQDFMLSNKPVNIS